MTDQAILILCEIGAIVLQFGPYIWESANDAKGDTDKVKDVYIRVTMAAIAALATHWLTDHNAVAAFIQSLAIHFALFDYTVNILLAKNLDRSPEQKKWFSYLGEKGVTDNISLWRNANPWVRLAVRVGILAGAVALYIFL